MIGYKKCLMRLIICFLIKNDTLLKDFIKICDEVSNSIKKWDDSETLYHLVEYR